MSLGMSSARSPLKLSAFTRPADTSSPSAVSAWERSSEVPLTRSSKNDAPCAVKYSNSARAPCESCASPCGAAASECHSDQFLRVTSAMGVVRTGMLADLVIVPENPLSNLKVLYGTGHMRLNPQTNRQEKVGGVKYTIKDGIVYDARKLLAEVAAAVAAEKRTFTTTAAQR